VNAYNNLLRPQTEWVGALVSMVMAVVVFLLQEAMLFVPAIGQALAVFFLLWAVWSAWRGFRLYRYHRSLSSTHPFRLASNKLYRSESVYFMGKGFEWTAEHTKRMKDLYDRKNTVFLYPSRFEKALKRWLLVRKNSWLVSAAYAFFNSSHILNPYPPRNPTGSSAIHGIGTWEGEEDVYMNIDATNHILIVGGTGAGKSCCFQTLSAQDIVAGRPTIGIDPKGGFKVFSAMYDAAFRSGLLPQFKIIHLAFPEYSCQYNALGSYHRITEISTRITEGIDSEESFKQFAWLKSNYIAVGLHYLGKQATFERIKYYMTRCDEMVYDYCDLYIKRNCVNTEVAAQTVQHHLRSAGQGASITGHSPNTINMVKAVNELLRDGHMEDSTELQTIISYLHENVMHERKLIRNIEPILEKLTTGSIAQIMVPDYDNLESDRAILDWGQLINDGEILYVGTNALGDITVSSTFLQILLEDLTNYLGSRYQYGQDYGRMSPAKEATGFLKQNVALHFDEFSAVKTTAAKNLLARAGELGVKLRVYTQSHADFVKSLGSHDDAEAAYDGFGAIIMFRVNNQNTADILVSRLNKVGIEKEGKVFGYSDSSSPETPEDFASSAMQREEGETSTLLTHQNVMSLPTGEAFLLTNGVKLEKIRMPLIEVDEGLAPDSIRDMVDIMKNNDLGQVSSDGYSDTWFQSIYPEYTAQPPLVAARYAAPAPESEQSDQFLPPAVMTGAMESEIGAEAAEFSIHAGSDDHV